MFISTSRSGILDVEYDEALSGVVSGTLFVESMFKSVSKGLKLWVWSGEVFMVVFRVARSSTSSCDARRSRPRLLEGSSSCSTGWMLSPSISFMLCRYGFSLAGEDWNEPWNYYLKS